MVAKTKIKKQSKPMFFQSCLFKTVADEQFRLGIARVKCFDCSDVDFVVDSETGEKAGDVYDYRLLPGPLAHLGQNIPL